MNAQLLDKYNRLLQRGLHEMLEQARSQQTNLIVRQASTVAGAFVPASTCEEIAMLAVRNASRARTIEEVLELLSNSYASLFERSKNDGSDED